MNRKLLLITLILFHIQIFSQDLLTPIGSKSFGLNNHTNRDISYFSKIDSNKNTIIVGTTEKDSTFTDIITTKLNENLELVWQKRLSIGTNLSYDIPVKSFINSDNQLYIVGRSSFNESNSNGLIFIIKYDEDGNIIFNETIGDINGSDYFDYGYLDASLNDDGTLNLVYSPFDNQTYQDNDFSFLKISNKGEVLNSFTLEIPQNDLSGIIKNEKYYFLVKELVDETNYTYSYKFYTIQNENNIKITEISDTTFTNYYNNAIISKQVKLTIDANENCYLTCHNTYGNDTTEKINLSQINNSNDLVYSINTSDVENYFLVGSFINNQDEIIVVANNINTNTIDFISVDENNFFKVKSNPNNFLATGFKKNQDNSFFITTSNSNIRLFSNELAELKSFNTSNSYELVDFVKVDSQSISTIGTSYEKIFPESDYFTQLDIHSEKLNDTQILNNYSFSGIGTSKAFQQRVIIDNHNNYLVLVTEKMGPEYLGRGGTNPPLNKRIIKYDSSLNKIWESEVPEHIFNLVNNRGRDVDFFIDDSNYLYLNLPRAGDYYGLGYDLYKVSPNGDFEFVNTSYIADKFYENQNSIFLAKDYFLREDSSLLNVLDKESGNLIEQIDIGHEKFLDIFFIGSDYYFYTYEEVTNNTPDFLYLYKNGIKLFTRILSSNFNIFTYEIDDHGNLFTAGFRRVNKININNSFSYYYTSDDLLDFKRFNNGNIFIHLNDYSTLILDENLNFITYGDSVESVNPYLMTFENNILLGTRLDNSVRIINQDGEIIDYFKTKGYLHDWYSKFDNQGNLIMVGQFGDRIYTFNEYGWFRGFIHNYGTINNNLSVDDIAGDNIEHDFTLYPNPTSDILNINIQNQNIEKIILYDISGEKLRVYDKNSIDLKEYKAGLYIVKVHTKTRKVLTSKVIKI